MWRKKKGRGGGTKKEREKRKWGARPLEKKMERKKKLKGKGRDEKREKREEMREWVWPVTVGVFG